MSRWNLGRFGLASLFVAAVSLGATFAFMSPQSMPKATAASHEKGSNSGETKGSAAGDGKAIAIFAGGCFWCVEADFDKVPGVLETISGYAGGKTKNPTYRSVTYGNTGHYEVVKIVYDPKKVTYDKLLYTFWRTVDPTDPGGQFCDRGDSYKTAVFAVTPEQKQKALATKAETGKILKKEIATKIADLKPEDFYVAEAYHQNYYKRNPIRYKYYRTGCRRNARVKEVWGKEALVN